MVKLLITTLFIAFLIKGNAQEKCLQVDSIVFKYIPWEISSPLAFKEDYYLNSESRFLKIKSIDEKELIQSFLALEITDYSRLISNEGNMDIRMVIEIYSKSYIIRKTFLDNRKKYFYEGNLFLPSNELVNWLNINITPTNR